jgi:hypothetical protein
MRTLAAYATMGEVVTDSVNAERVRERAYAIYQSRQGGAGDAESDWLQAERELAAEATRGASPAAARSNAQTRARRNPRLTGKPTAAK